MDGTPSAANLESLPPNLKILRIPKYMPDNMNYDALPDGIEIIEWDDFYYRYKEINRFPASLKKIKMAHGNKKILEYFTDVSFQLEMKYIDSEP
jgi:hypothetical protein